MNTNLHHEKILYLYSQALENGDFETISAVFEQAADDSELKTLLFELDALYQAEFPVETMAIERLSMSEPQLLHTGSSNGYHSPMPARHNISTENAKNRRWIWRVAAAFIIVLGAIWLYQAYLNSSDEVHVEVTPSFAQSPITAENVDQLQEIRRYGEGQVTGGLWTPEGERVVIHGTLGIWIYDAENLTGEPIRTIDTDSAINDADLSPDGTLLATAREDGAMFVYNLDTGQVELSVRASDRRTWLIAFSPDGQTIATAGSDGGGYSTVKLWSAIDGRKVLTAGESFNSVYSLVFSANGERLAWSGVSQVWLSTPPGEYPVSVRPSIIVMDLTTRETQAFDAGEGLPPRIALSPDGHTVAAIAYGLESELRVWNVEDIQEFQPPRPRLVSVDDGLTDFGYTEAMVYVVRIEWRGDGMISLLHAGPEFTISDWNIDTLEVVNVASFVDSNSTPELRRLLQSSSQWDYSPDGEQVLITSDGNVLIGDIALQQPIAFIQLGNNRLSSFALHSTPVLLAIADTNTITIWDVETDTIVTDIGYDPQAGGVTDLAFLPDGETLVIARNAFQGNQNFTLWNVTSDDVSSLMTPQANWQVMSIGINSDATELAYVTSSETVKLYDMPSGQTVSLTTNDSSRFYLGDERVRFQPNDDNILAYTTGDTFIHIITHEGEAIADLTGNTNDINDMAFSPDGRYLASVNDDGILLIWDTENWDEIAYVEVGAARALAFNADSSLIAVGGEQDITFWDVDTESLVGTIEGHTTEVFQLAFTAGGNTLASLSYDGTLRLWAVE
jgi:WD40 repeat protein